MLRAQQAAVLEPGFIDGGAYGFVARGKTEVSCDGQRMADRHTAAGRVRGNYLRSDPGSDSSPTPAQPLRRLSAEVRPAEEVRTY